MVKVKVTIAVGINSGIKYVSVTSITMNEMENAPDRHIPDKTDIA